MPKTAHELTSLMSSGDQAQSLRSEQRLKVLTPFLPIPGSKPWGVLLDVPEKVLVGPAQTLQAELDERNKAGAPG
jgi:methyl-accepting chemotaxis protein